MQRKINHKLKLIQLLLRYMHDVVSAAYGCLHDFGDKFTARAIFEENIIIFNKKWNLIYNNNPTNNDKNKNNTIVANQPIMWKSSSPAYQS